MCITCTIVKVNIFPWSPNLGHTMISFYKMYTSNKIGAVHNEVNCHGKIYVIDFMCRMYSMVIFVTFNIFVMVSNSFGWQQVPCYLSEFIAFKCYYCHVCNVLLQYLDEAVC